MTEQRKRKHGIASREAIVDAAAHIAGERGYEGTSINAVSEASGLPASSIYWHFENKDQLIAAVIDRSFGDWVGALDRRVDLSGFTDPQERFAEGFRDSARQLQAFPDFLRLGLMLLLEHRPKEPAARQRFQEVRQITIDRICRNFEGTFRGIDEGEARRLATFTLAASDGLFIAADAEGVDLVDAFDTLARAVWNAALATGWRPEAEARG